MENPAVTDGLLKATFYSWPKKRRDVVDHQGLKVFIKHDGPMMRIHHVETRSSEQLRNNIHTLINSLEILASQKGEHTITWGGGDDHIYPGIPLDENAPTWLEYFEAMGPEVHDYEGLLSTVIDKSSKIRLEGALKSPTNEAEIRALISFVSREFPGRWARECESDARKGLIKQYFAYLIEDKIAGYVRLYGWDPSYWAPGVYFAQPGHSQGGLGPIGVGREFRGRGYGTQILKASWEILKERKIVNVRIDWTTETSFYEQWGFQIVQRYQPAQRRL
jgi:GNAT superfamily N-acetyltransferase